jgi:hypothetical protein
VRKKRRKRTASGVDACLPLLHKSLKGTFAIAPYILLLLALCFLTFFLALSTQTQREQWRPVELQKE